MDGQTTVRHGRLLDFVQTGFNNTDLMTPTLMPQSTIDRDATIAVLIFRKIYLYHFIDNDERLHSEIMRISDSSQNSGLLLEW